MPIDPLDLTIHVGSGKTGTTSIQHFLHRNRRRLADSGVLYPRTPGRQRHVRLGLYLKPDDEVGPRISRRYERYGSPDDFRRDFVRRLFAEIERSGLTRLLLSDESLYGSSGPTLTRVREFTDQVARRLRVVVYLRRQDEHLASHYQRLVRTGEVRRLTDYLEQEEFTDLYDHHARLRCWQRVVEPTEVVVRPFEPAGFTGGSLYEDFVDAAGLDVRASDLDRLEHRNVSMDAESVEFVRLVNLFRVAQEGALPGKIDNRALGRRLARRSAGPTLVLPDDARDRFMARWSGPNEAVARQYLERKELFRTRRTSRPTTTVQILDPERLDHFLALGEVPERAHRALRRLAEREAAGTGY